MRTFGPSANTERGRVTALVIGGGLLGCVVTYYLACEGMDVLLVDKGQLNLQASGQNAGSLHFQLEYRMIERGEEYAREAAEAMPLHLHAQRLWKDLEAELGTSLGVVQCGGLMVAERAEEVRTLEAKIALEREYGLEVELLDGARLRQTAPYLGSSILAAALCPTEGKADPRRCAFAFAGAAARHGAAIRSRLAVVGMRRVNAFWQVSFDDGTTCLAEMVVIAAGAWSGRIAAMAGTPLPVVPVGLMMSATARTKPFLEHLLQHAGRRLSMKQNGDGNILIGGGWPAALSEDDRGFDLEAKPQVLLSSISGNMSTAGDVVPAVLDLPILRIWSGMTAEVPDQLPLLGEVPGCSGCFIATGGSAFTLGPTYARILADKILGKTNLFDVTAYNPARYAEPAHA